MGCITSEREKGNAKREVFEEFKDLRKLEEVFSFNFKIVNNFPAK